MANDRIESQSGEELEEIFEKLDGVISQLESDEISLEKSFILYNQGMDAIRRCNAAIDMIEKKVQLIDQNGESHEF